jgi:DNA polymerase (family 10)
MVIKAKEEGFRRIFIPEANSAEGAVVEGITVYPVRDLPALIGHLTGRILLRRDGYEFDVEAVLKSAASHKVAMELNAYPDRLDLCERHLRLAHDLGVKIVINTDAHHTSHMEKMRYGILQARRAWLTKDDVLNTLPVKEFAKAIRRE